LPRACGETVLAHSPEDPQSCGSRHAVSSRHLGGGSCVSAHTPVRQDLPHDRHGTKKLRIRRIARPNRHVATRKRASQIFDAALSRLRSFPPGRQRYPYDIARRARSCPAGHFTRRAHCTVSRIVGSKYGCRADLAEGLPCRQDSAHAARSGPWSMSMRRPASRRRPRVRGPRRDQRRRAVRRREGCECSCGAPDLRQSGLASDIRGGSPDRRLTERRFFG
jgi:hypothetical protein